MRILIIEDQNLIGKAVQKGLVEEGFAVDWATSLEEGRHLALEFDYDTIILDLMLPDGSGFTFLADFRRTSQTVPVLILSAKETIPDKMEGFRLGADDYLTKPFVFEELLARVRALTRRKYQFHGQSVDIGALKIDFYSRTASVQGVTLVLTAKEFAVLEYFVLRRAHVLSRERIAEHLYSDTSEQESNVIDVFVNKLRRKLEAAGVGSLIETVRGEGYIIR